MAKYYTKFLPWTVATAQKYLRSFSIQNGENETVNDNVSLFSTRTCLFTAANDRSHKCFHRYVQRDINSSHLLHKSTLSGGQSKGHREHGDIGDTYCTLSSNTPVLPPTEKGQRHGEGDREKGGREEGKERRGGAFGLIFKYKRTCTNRIASRHCAPIFTVIVTGSGTTPWQDHPFEICRYKGSLWENQASAMRSDIKTNGVWEAGNSGEEAAAVAGRGEGSQTHARCSLGGLITVEKYIIRFYLSERSLKLGVRALANSLHTQRGTHSQTLGLSYFGHNVYDLQSCTMHRGTEKCTHDNTMT